MGHDATYLKAAEKILWNLSSPAYMNIANENQNMLLKHSTENKPKNTQVDVPIIYADYYFVEALYRYVKLKNTISTVPEVSDMDKFLTVFPNPLQHKLTIQSKAEFDRLELQDVTGNVVFAKLFSYTTNEMLYIPDKLNNGFYIEKIFTGNKLIGCEKVFK